MTEVNEKYPMIFTQSGNSNKKLQSYISVIRIVSFESNVEPWTTKISKTVFSCDKSALLKSSRSSKSLPYILGIYHLESSRYEPVPVEPVFHLYSANTIVTLIYVFGTYTFSEPPFYHKKSDSVGQSYFGTY